MSDIPVPSHVHYELLLQVLERQTTGALNAQNVSPKAREYLRDTVINLRKAFSLQKQAEELCRLQGVAVSYRWSIQEAEQPQIPSKTDD